MRIYRSYPLVFALAQVCLSQSSLRHLLRLIRSITDQQMVLILECVSLDLQPITIAMASKQDSLSGVMTSMTMEFSIQIRLQVKEMTFSAKYHLVLKP